MAAECDVIRSQGEHRRHLVMPVGEQNRTSRFHRIRCCKQFLDIRRQYDLTNRSRQRRCSRNPAMVGLSRRCDMTPEKHIHESKDRHKVFHGYHFLRASCLRGNESKNWRFEFDQLMGNNNREIAEATFITVSIFVILAFVERVLVPFLELHLSPVTERNWDRR